MSSSATNTEGQITIAKGAEGVCARWINGDIGAFEIGRTIRRFDALAATCASLSSAHLGKRRNDFALWQGAHRPGVDLHVEAGSLDQHKCAGISNVAADGADSPAINRDGVCVEPPLTAEIDGKAATIVVCHGRRSLLYVRGIAQNDAKAARLMHFAEGVQFVPLPYKMRVLFRYYKFPNKRALNISAVAFGKPIEGEDYGFGCGGFGNGHFISPTPDYPRRGRFALLHPMSCIIHIKQQNASDFCNLFSGRKTSPLTNQANSAARFCAVRRSEAE